MKRKRIKRGWTAAALALAIGLGSFGRPGSAADGEMEWRFQAGFTEPATGRTYYEAYGQAGGAYDFRVVYATKEGEWQALPAGYWGIGAARPDGTYLLGEYATVSGTMLSSSVYDPAEDRLVHRTLYEPSPDGKWGLRLAVRYPQINRPSMGKELVVLTKNLATGLVREAAFSAFYSGMRWMPDSRLLGNVYSEEAGQNEIVVIDPATGETRRLLLGSLHGYDPADGSILFVYNEPSRTERVYDLRTGAVRTATPGDVQRFAAAGAPGERQPERRAPAVEPPAGLRPDRLPVGPVAESTVYEAQAVINGQPVGLPNAFQEEDRTWLALQPLLQPFGLRVEKAGAEPYAGRFRIAGPGGAIEVDDADSRNFGGRLFLTKDQLLKLGLRLQWLAWLPGTTEEDAG